MTSNTIETVTVTGKASYVDGKLSNFLTDSAKVVKVNDVEKFVIGTEVVYAKPYQGYFYTSKWHIIAPELIGRIGIISAISVEGRVTIEYADGDSISFMADRIERATIENIAMAQKLLEKATKNCKRINAADKARRTSNR